MQVGLSNLLVRKTYGQDAIRYLRCRSCQSEFSERKGSALWNSKISEEKAEAVAAHLAEGCSQAATTRLVKVDPSVVKRLSQRLGKHGQAFHALHARQIRVKALQADERHGYVERKTRGCWEAEVMDPVSKFVVSHAQGARDADLIKTVLEDAASRLHNRHDLLLLTDGEASYATFFPELFGRAYHPARQGTRGRLPNIAYRIPRTAGHVQIVKRREGGRVVSVEIRLAHGSQKFAQQRLSDLGYAQFNTSAIERRNGTARRMNAYQVRRSSAFAHHPERKADFGWWGVTVYNWVREHRSLRLVSPDAEGKKTLLPHSRYGDWTHPTRLDATPTLAYPTSTPTTSVIISLDYLQWACSKFDKQRIY
jgi:transposase-like protein/IS1 family transposase